jgi:hypothetical protein
MLWKKRNVISLYAETLRFFYSKFEFYGLGLIFLADFKYVGLTS